MIDLLPLPTETFKCVCSDTKLVNDGFILPGMMPLVKNHCTKCGRRMLSHLSHGWRFGARLLYDEADRSVISAGAMGWYEGEFRSAIASRERPMPPLEKISRRPLGKDVVIVNSLDPTYGHILQRLFSIDGLEDSASDSDLLFIVPRLAAWLVPDAAAEIWIVDAPLKELHLWNGAIAQGIADLSQRVDRLRLAPMRLGGYTVDVSRFTRVKPFDASTLDDVIPPRLTLSWREDRCWTLRGQKREPDEAVVEQFTMVCKMFDILRENIPDLDVAVIGYGKKGGFAPWVQDLRVTEHDTEKERAWAQRCAQSHLVMGVQGSNMTLPAAHAAGSLELMPITHWGHNMATWEWINRRTAYSAMQSYLHIPLSSSFSDIISIAFIQLRRMQNHALWAVHGILREQSERDRLALAALEITKGGHAIEYRDEAGHLL